MIQGPAQAAAIHGYMNKLGYTSRAALTHTTRKEAMTWIDREKQEPPTDRVILVWHSEWRRDGHQPVAAQFDDGQWIDTSEGVCVDFDCWMLAPALPDEPRKD